MRQSLIEIYKLNEDIINIIVKFFAGIIVFVFMSFFSGGDLAFSRKFIIIILGGIFAVISSPAVFLVVSAIAMVVFIASVSIEAAMVAFVFLFLLYVFYGRIFPEESLLFIAMLVCFKLKVPYIIPILGGIYFGISAVVPASAAMFTNQIYPVFEELVKMAPVSKFSVSSMPDTLFNMYTYIFSEGLESVSGSFYVSVTMVLTVVSAWAISSTHINYDKEIAIIVSGVITILGMFLAVIVGESGFSVIGFSISVIISAVFVYLIRTFDDMPDYRRTEKVKFQDKNYIYYVKAVPKIKVSNNDYRGDD